MGNYLLNNETLKIELHFDKAEYINLDDTTKKAIKSNFLFSRYNSAWVSRCKWPHTGHAEDIAKRIGLENAGTQGEMLSFEEQQERKAERAERRAERYEYKSDKAYKEGERLQAPIERMHGDIAFFTQPNINTSAGRAFTRQRNRMWDAWERGFEEFKKSNYYKEAAEAARRTAQKPNDIGFCERRIKEAEKDIRAQKKNINTWYQPRLDKINNGEKVYNAYTHEEITADEVMEQIDRAELIIEQAISKIAYYTQCIEDLGGMQYNKDNIKPGYIVKIGRYREPVEIISTGKVNVTYKSSCGFTLKASYGEIVEVVKAEEAKQEAQPFKAGETFTVCNKEYTITKATDKTVTIKGDNKEYRRTPKKRYIPCENRERWCLEVIEGYMGTVYR